MPTELDANDPLSELIVEFEEMEDWDDRYEFLIELGRELPPLPDDYRLDKNKVDGCMSTVWMVTELEQPVGQAENGDVATSSKLTVHADSDSIMVKGLIAILLAAYSNRSVQYAAAYDIDKLFQRLGLNQHLSPNRRNGLFSMVKRIKAAVVSCDS